MGSRYFKHKYTRMATGRDERAVKRMMTLLLTRRDMMKDVYDAKTVRGFGQCISGHFIILRMEHR